MCACVRARSPCAYTSWRRMVEWRWMVIFKSRLASGWKGLFGFRTSLYHCQETNPIAQPVVLSLNWQLYHFPTHTIYAVQSSGQVHSVQMNKCQLLPDDDLVSWKAFWSCVDGVLFICAPKALKLVFSTTARTCSLYAVRLLCDILTVPECLNTGG